MANWHEGLKNLANSLGGFANYYSALEEREWQERRDNANRMFQERLIQIQQTHSEKMADKQITAAAQEGAANRELTRSIEDNRLKIEEERGRREDERHATSVELQRQQIDISRKSNEDAAEDRDANRRIAATQDVLNNVTAQINAINKSMQAELKDVNLIDPAKAELIREKYSAELSPLVERQRELLEEVKGLADGTVDDPLVEEAVATIAAMDGFGAAVITDGVEQRMRAELKSNGMSSAQVNEVVRQIKAMKK